MKLPAFLRPQHRCRDCRFCEDQWLGSIQGQGLYGFSYCGKLVYDLRLVDADVKRRCVSFDKRGSVGSSWQT